VLLGAGAAHMHGTTFGLAGLRVYSSATGALLETWENLTNVFAVVPDSNADGRLDCLLSNGSTAALVLGGLDGPEPWLACPLPQDASNGCTPWIQASGTPSLTQYADLELRVSQLPGSTVGLCFYGTNRALTPFGSGVLCLAPPMRRTALSSSVPGTGTCPVWGPSTVVHCTLSKLDLLALGLSAGDRFFAQAWLRDPGYPPPGDVVLSGALSIQIWP